MSAHTHLPPVDATERVIEASEIVAKMQSLSEDRVARVLSLIEDLAELQARENEEDIAAAHRVIASGGNAVLWENLKAELDGIDGHD